MNIDTPHITGGELDNDPDTDAVPNNLLKGVQGYVGDQSALVAAISAELTKGGMAQATIAQYLPQIEAAANGILGIFAPELVPVAKAVEGVVNGAVAPRKVARPATKKKKK